MVTSLIRIRLVNPHSRNILFIVSLQVIHSSAHLVNLCLSILQCVEIADICKRLKLSKLK